jgi:PAS domain S-box-containing protein
MFFQRIRRDFGLQLLALYLLLVIPALGIIVVFDVVESRRIREEAVTRDLTLAKTIAQQTDVAISNALNAVEQLSQYPAVRSGSIENLPAIFSIVQGSRPDIELIFRLDKNGRAIYHFPSGSNSFAEDNFAVQSYFQQARDSEAAFLSEGRVLPGSGEPIATAVMPLRTRDGTFIGIIAANIKLEGFGASLQKTLEEHDPNKQGFQVFIVDHTGTVVAHAETQAILKNIRTIAPDVSENILDRQAGSKIGRDANSQEQLYTYAPISTARWAIVTSRPTAEAFARQILLRRITLAAFFSFAGIGILFWGALYRQVLNPLKSLATISQRIGEERQIGLAAQNQLQQLSRRRDQVGELTVSMTRMEKSIQARMNEQATLLETSQAVVSSLDIKIVLNLILEQVERLMNVEKIAIITLDEQSNLYRIRASRGLSKKFVEQAILEPDESLSATMRAIRSGKPVQIVDTESDPNFIPLLPHSRDGGYRSVLAVPLQSNYDRPSALLVFKPESYEFSINEIQLLSNFANQAAMAMENAALYAKSDQRLKEQTRRLEALIQSMQDGLILGDLDGKVIYTNRRIAELSRLSNLELAEMTVSRVMSRVLSQLKQSQDVRSQVQQDLSEPESRDVEINVAIKGREISLRFHAFDVTDPDNISIGRGILIQDMTADRQNDRMKTNLISTVSHELRTPLAAIKGYASTLLATDVEWSRESTREFLEIISDESDRLSELVNNLLDLSRLETGSLKIQPIECDIREVIDNAAKRSLSLFGTRPQVEIPDNLSIISADQPRLETILRNLLENAAKYAGEQAKIGISVTRISDKIIFRVEDDGPGIAPEESERIFDPFYRVDNLFSRGAGGTGLGLAICRGLVKAHQGEIWIEPRANGACFAFSIPLITTTTTTTTT